MILFSIIGAIIGAGFISGQEILVFFYKYGINGILGLIVCNILIGYCIYKILKIINENDINNFEDFINVLTNFKFIKINKFINIIINIFLLLSFFIMIAGFGSFFEQEFKIYRIIGAFLLASIAFILFIGNVRKIVKINDRIVPILIVIIVFIGMLNLFKINEKDIYNLNINKGSIYWILDAVIYASYNILLIIPGMINLKEYIKEKKEIKIISITISALLLIISILVFFILIKNNNLNNIDMPILYIIKKEYNSLSMLYGIILLIAIFTTAISIGMGLIKNISNENNKLQVSFIICFSSVIISNFGFATLVKNIYPIIGYIGLVVIYYLIK